MRNVRIVQWTLVALAAIYLAWLQWANPEPLRLPVVGEAPTLAVLAAVAVLAYLAGRLPAERRARRDRHERDRVARRLDDLEAHLPSYDRTRDRAVIPDRIPAVADEAIDEPNDGSSGRHRG